MEGTRRYPRAGVSFATEVWVDKGGVSAFADGRFIVLGAGGGRLEVGETIPIGNILRLRFRFPPRFEDIICRSIVRNALEGKRRGVGVEFLDLSPRDRERMSAFVDQQSDLPWEKWTG